MCRAMNIKVLRFGQRKVIDSDSSIHFRVDGASQTPSQGFFYFLPPQSQEFGIRGLKFMDEEGEFIYLFFFIF